MTPKFKVGDKIYLKKLADVKDTRGVGIVDDMYQFFGTLVTIREVIDDNFRTTYLIEEDSDIGSGFEYDEIWFCGLTYNWEDII